MLARRFCVSAALAGLLALGLPGAAPAAKEMARGTVFEDLDRDGVFDDGEPGLPEVRVSNGRQVTLTGQDGAWELEVREGDILFVTKPAGWMTAVSRDMIPRFYYIHQPEGSPKGLHYPGVTPTGPLPQRIDFALRRRDEPSRFEAILVADPQPQSAIELDYVRDDVVAELIGTRALFGMTMGDILFDDLSLFARSNAIMAQVGIPWYNVPGNHEMNLDASDDAGSLETFKRHFGPPYYSFEVADAVFYVLDNIEYEGGGEPDPADYRALGAYIAKLGKQQRRWLERDLEFVPDDKLIFLAMHAPLETYLGDNATDNTQDRKALFKLLKGRAHLYAVAGHTHTTEHHYFGEEDGFAGPGRLHQHVLATVSGSWWSGPLDARGIADATQRDGTPNGYHILEVDGVDVKVRYRAAGGGEDRQMRLLFDVVHHGTRPEVVRTFRPGELLDGRISEDAIPSARLIVNLFDGGPRSEVRFRIGDGPELEMQRSAVADPHFVDLAAHHPGTMKPWVMPTPSSHVWIGELPDDLGAGTYTVTVTAVDEFGRSHHAHRVLEVAGSSAPHSSMPQWVGEGQAPD